jgi:hypothetical protein
MRILQSIAWIILLTAELAHGAPGDVDPSFVYPRPPVLEPDSTNAIPLADGLLVVKSRGFDKAGSDSTLELTRIDEDGRVVNGFGSGGSLTITMPGAVNVSTAVKGLLNGSMLLAGFQRQTGAVSDNLAAIARLDSTGHLDPTFGVGGVATFDVPGQLDRVGAIDVLEDGHIMAGVWSQVERDPYGDCSTDRVSLVRLNPDGSAPEVIYFRDRNDFPDNNECRNTMTLQVMPDQQFYFGSAVEIAVFSAPESGAWHAVTPYGCCRGPFAVDPTEGPVWTYESPYGGWLETAASFGGQARPRTWFPESWFYSMGIPGPRTTSPLVADGDGPGWFLGVSSDGGIAGIAKLRHDGWLDTGWAGGSGMVRIEGAGRANVIASEGLANDIRLLSVRPGGETLVVVTADGVIERRLAKSGPAHGAIHFTYGDVAAFSEFSGAAQVRVLREGGSDGAISVDYQTSDAGSGYDCAYAACANSGSDYVATSGRLDWGDGDSSERIITIPIVNDTQHEPLESFNLQLITPTGGAVILGSDTLAISIIDDDPAAPSVSSSGHGSSSSGGSGGGGATGAPMLAMLLLFEAIRRHRRRAMTVCSRRGPAPLSVASLPIPPVALASVARAVLGAAFAVLLSGCAPAIEVPSASRPTTATVAPIADANAARDDAIVCRTENETGSRVRRYKICMTPAEWEAHRAAARRYTESIERSRSTQVGGDSLTPSTPGG